MIDVFAGLGDAVAEKDDGIGLFDDGEFVLGEKGGGGE